MPASPDQLPRFEPALRVLVADDNELNQLVVCQALEDWNVTVMVADNGRQALEMAFTQSFDAVLMDIQMPEMDGYEATRQLRRHARFHALPIIGLTASASAEDQALALAVGMNTTLPKPFDPLLLHASLVRYTQPPAVSPVATAASTATAASAPTEAIIPDWTLLEELAAGNEGFIAQIIVTFLQQTPGLYQQLVAASTSPDWLTQARLAHKLKGQIVYFGVPAMQQHLEKLERPVPPADLPDSRYLIDDIGYQLAALYPQLQSRLHKFQPDQGW